MVLGLKNNLNLSEYGGECWLTTWQSLELLTKQVSGHIWEEFYRFILIEEGRTILNAVGISRWTGAQERMKN